MVRCAATTAGSMPRSVRRPASVISNSRTRLSLMLPAASRPGHATAVAPGTVLGPDVDPQGWAVTRVEEIVPARIPAFEQVRDRVRARWLEERLARRLQEAVEHERGRTKIVRHPERLDPRRLEDLAGD